MGNSNSATAKYKFRIRIGKKIGREIQIRGTMGWLGWLIGAAVLEYVADDVILWFRQHRCYSIKELPAALSGLSDQSTFTTARRYAAHKSLYSFWSLSHN